MTSPKYIQYSTTDTTLDSERTTPVGSGFVDKVSSMTTVARSSAEIVAKTRDAMTLKTEKISLSQIPVGHDKAKSLINPELKDSDSDTAVKVLRHYCVVEGLCAGRDAMSMPPEMFTIIYEFVDESTDSSDEYAAYRELKVRMLGDDFGVVDTHIRSSSIELGSPVPKVKSMFKVNPAGKLVVAPTPLDGVDGFKDLKLNTTLSVTFIIHRMVHAAKGNGPRSNWSAGMRVTVLASGNRDRSIDNHLVKFFHLNEINPKLKKDSVIEPGTYIGTCGRTGMMDPLAKNGKDQFPHLHLEVTKWTKDGQKKYDPRKKLRKSVLKDGVPVEWNGWINHKTPNEHAPYGFSPFGKGRVAGTRHGGLDIGIAQGTKIYSPIKGKVFWVFTKEEYIKLNNVFKDVLAAHNERVRQDGYIFRFVGRDGKTYSIPFSKGQTLSLGPNDLNLQTHVAGKVTHRLKVEVR